MSQTLAELQAEAQAETEKEQKQETLLESLASICTVLACGLFLMTFVFQNFVIPSGSMEKTLLVGDHVFVDRITLAPPTHWAPFVHYRDVRHGDIIVFMKPNPESPDLVLVKRAIGLPGDHLHLEAGIVYLNGVRQDQPYAARPGQPVIIPDSQDAYDQVRDEFPRYGAPPSTLTTESWTQELPSHIADGDLIVPPGKVFAMGDNRGHSADSRFWGFVPRENILGRPLFNYWSFETTADTMEEQQSSLGSRIGSFFTTLVHVPTRTRWSRTLHLIK